MRTRFITYRTCVHFALVWSGVGVAACQKEEVHVNIAAPSANKPGKPPPGRELKAVKAMVEMNDSDYDKIVEAKRLAAAGGLAPVKTLSSSEDFVEAEANRDPFRKFPDIFAAKLSSAPQRAVVMPSSSIDEMRLIAIVAGSSLEYAMVIDGSGVGYTLRRGDYVGRPDIIQVGGAEGVPVTINWRVDRIRPNEIVLSREDPTAPNRPPLIRSVPLRDSTEPNPAK